MKRLALILFLLIAFVFAKAQYPIQQSVANAPNTIGRTNAMRANDGFVNGVFVDTTAANLKQIKAYPGAQIFTTLDSSFWLRNPAASRWLKANAAAGSITSFTFITDSSLIVCYADGSCDTIPINNFTEIVNNIVQNFNDSSIYNLNDSTLIICNGQGVCDTISLGTTNTYSIFFDSTTNNYYAVTCDTMQAICVPGVLIADSCYNQQVCDTILIPRPSTHYQNGVWYRNGIVEHGYPTDGPSQGQLIHDTYIWNENHSYNITGWPIFGTPLRVRNNGWSQASSTVAAFNHQGNSWLIYPGAIDNSNTVDLRLNYINRFATPSSGIYTGDTIGTMLDRIGYSWMTNSAPYWLSYQIDNPIAKQVGIMFHTLDTAYDDAVTIFGQKVPSAYALYDSTLLSKRIAVFKTEGTVQFPYYPNTRDDGVANKAIIPLDDEGNLGVGSVIAATSIVEIITDTSFRVCDLNGVCDTFVVDIDDPSVINIYNDTTIIICNEAGSCDTITVNNYTITNGQIINIANTLFVSKAGNDGLGQRQRLDLHFLTIRAAIDAAMTGDAIVVFPGTYEEQVPISLAKSLSFQFMGKGLVRLTTSLGSDPVFTDSNTVNTSVVDGPGWKFEARSTQKVINQTAPSFLTFIAKEIVSASGKTIEIYDSASLNVKADLLYGNAFSGAIWTDSALSLTASIDLIQVGAFGNAIWTKNTNDIQVYSKRIIAAPNNDDYLIYFFDTEAGDSIYVQADELRSGTEWAIWAKGESPAMFVHAKTISANSDCVVTSSTDPGGMLTVQADLIENLTTGAIDGTIHGEGGSLTVIGAQLKRDASATGNDIRTVNFGGDDGYVYLNSVTYDITKVSESPAGTIKRIDSLYYGSNFQFTNGRLETDTAQIASANNLELGRANVNLVSGATQVTAIYTAGWQAGSASVHLLFAGAPLVKNNTAGGAGTATILLAGLTDFQAAAGDVLSLLYDGTNWRETNRALASGAGITGITADEGLTTSSATNVRLFGTVGTPATLTTDRYLTAGSNTLNITFNSLAGASGLNLTSTSTAATGNLQRILNINLSGANANASQNTYGLYINNARSGSSNANYGIWVETSNEAGGAGIVSNATNAVAVNLQSANTTAALISVYPSSTNTIIPNTQFKRFTTGTAANGIGESLDFIIQTSTGSQTAIANQVRSQWTDATNGTRTSQLDITGVNSASTGTIMSAHGTGVVGIGISSGYVATRLEVVDNAVGAASMINITSTSTAAAGDAQKGINIALSGANATNDQDTYGIYSSNAHTGTGNANYGVYGTSTGAPFLNYGVYGTVPSGNGTGVYGISTDGSGVIGYSTGSSAYGVQGQHAGTSGTGYGVYGASTGAKTNGYAGYFTSGDATHSYGIRSTATGVGTNNYALYLEADGATNDYALVIPAAKGNVGIGTITPSVQALLELVSTTQAFIVMRMTATQASAITAADGMILYTTDTDATFTSVGFWGREAGVWVKL